MARRWTAVDRETGEIYEFSSRDAMRSFARDNPTVRGRERESIAEALHLPPGISIEQARRERTKYGTPSWRSEHWTAQTVSMKRERAFNNATAGLRFAYVSALSANDPVSAARIRSIWEQNVKAYAEGKIDAKSYGSGMADAVTWLGYTPYSPPVPIHYHEGGDDYDPDDSEDQEDWDYEDGDEEDME